MALPNKDAVRARLALEILAGAQEPVGRAALWERIVAEHPLSESESEEHQSGGSRGEKRWAYTTIEFVKAGWLVKGGKQGWSITLKGIEALERAPDADSLRSEARGLYASWSKKRDEERVLDLSSGIVAQGEHQEEILSVARLFVERGLSRGESVFVPGRAIWTTKVADELVRLFVHSDGVDGANFREKVEIQLRTASDDARLLMAELVTLQLLPAWMETIGEKSKRERVTFMLELMEHPVQIPAEIDRAFSSGSFNFGAGMATNLGAAMAIVVNFVAAWVALDGEMRDELLADPWAFRELMRSVPGNRFPSQRHSLLYLVHPAAFVSIVSDTHKRAIRDAFIGEIGGVATDDIDRDLLAITIALQVKDGGPALYYEEPLHAKWNEEKVLPADPTDPSESLISDASEEAQNIRRPFRRVTAALAESLFMDAEWPQMALDLLERRKQIILHGPPGTGKTFIARKLAEHIAAGTETRLVQFHPSYSYEDFVEGYRPISKDGVLSYELKEGPFRRIAREAAKNRDRSYVLVIDEINRGNLPKIFGELYFLLEYREAQIALLYGGEEDFSLPDNVFIIGTMNTTDRSIALLDRAMRRRFAFIELHPDVEPAASVLSNWLSRRSESLEPAALLSALNARIDDYSAKIGPSYLMPADGNLSEPRLQEIWRHELLPLLEEHHYGEGRDLEKEYGLTVLRRRLTEGTPE